MAPKGTSNGCGGSYVAGQRATVSPSHGSKNPFNEIFLPAIKNIHEPPFRGESVEEARGFRFKKKTLRVEMLSGGGRRVFWVLTRKPSLPTEANVNRRLIIKQRAQDTPIWVPKWNGNQTQIVRRRVSTSKNGLENDSMCSHSQMQVVTGRNQTETTDGLPEGPV